MQQFFEYSPEVEDALKHKKPILALESTVITHGLPYPHNLETAQTLERIVKAHAVVPATIAIIKGKIKIGLTPSDLEYLVHEPNVFKASTRDLPYLLSQGLSAGTTVAATLYCADAAGIKVFATGGIGGVHRGSEQDVSADLIELARTPMAVVSSGVKAILDLPKTLQFLETFGIPIVGYRTHTLPAFYTAETNYKLPARIDTLPELVKLLKVHWQLGMTSSILIANPIPKEDEIPVEYIEPVINEALRQAAEKDLQGKEITPFILNEVMHATEGKSLQANIQLLKNNITLGAMLAHAIANI
ncbi:MAG: pseudouridine-5'-phosphate glycosidase [Gammaproteobacteria bacterium]|nr:pseudouridine-5'-phosphate glycosidase [Gammaproteobacteria bacterium]